MGRRGHDSHAMDMEPHRSLPATIRRVALATVAVALVATPFASAAEARITKGFTPRASTALSPGVNYRFGRMTTSGGHPQQVFVGTVDPRNPAVRLKALLSNDRVVKRAVVRNITLRKQRPGFKALISTNGDMSTRNRTDGYAAPHSMAVSKGELMVATACTRPTLGVDAQGNVAIDDVRAQLLVTPPGSKVPVRIHKVNTPRDNGQVVLFTKRFASSTQTSYGGREVIVSLEGKLRPNDSRVVRVLKVRKNGGNTPLRAGQAVISVKNRAQKWVYQLRAGQRLRLDTRVVRSRGKPCAWALPVAPDFRAITEAQGGNYFTLRNGRIAAPTANAYGPGSQRHPRSGLGVTADGRVLMVVVDGRRSASHGVTLAEMGELMRSLGAVSAFNLDGGGSSVMTRWNPARGRYVVANKPSDGRQRPATQAFAVFRRVR